MIWLSTERVSDRKLSDCSNGPVLQPALADVVEEDLLEAREAVAGRDRRHVDLLAAVGHPDRAVLGARQIQGISPTAKVTTLSSSNFRSISPTIQLKPA